MLAVGTKAPDFELIDATGKTYRLSDYLGQKVVLYFYPKDNTPGCTMEALNYKEFYEQFKNHNVMIFGISKDSPASHQKFIEKYDLPFVLLSDQSLEMLQDYEVYGPKKFMGKDCIGIIRTTYIIDENGIIISSDNKVKAKQNASDTFCLLGF